MSDDVAVPESYDPVEERQAHDRLQAALFGRTAPIRELSRYRLGDKLGEGGYGVVYAAHDPQLDRDVAIKLIRLRGEDVGPDDIARLEREARVLARLSHPNIVQIYDVGRYDDGVFVVTELVEGKSLRAWLAVAHGEADKYAVLDAAAAGLAAAHREGIAHRDFKPGNVMVGDDGRVRVLDFGLARSVAGGSVATPSQTSHEVVRDDDDAVTAAGTVAGTPAYMAPEQRAGGEVDVRSDQYSFCATAYEVLCGRRPPRLDSGAPRSPPKPAGLSSRRYRVLARGLAVDPGRRFASMDELRGALSRSRRSRWPAALTASALAAAVLGGVAMPRAEALPVASPEVCASDLSDVWGPAQAEAVRAGVQGTGVSYADTTANILVSQLDEFAASWAQVVREVGSAADPETAIAMCQCLHRQRDNVRALVGKWGELDEDRVWLAIYEAGEAVADPAWCRSPPKRPTSELAPAQRDAFNRRLTDLNARRYGGKIAEQIGESEKLCDEVTEAADAWLQAEACGHVADLYYQSGRFDDAEKMLRRVYESSVASGHDNKAAWAAAVLVQIVGAIGRRPDDAAIWVRHGRAAVERASNPVHGGILAQSEAFMYEVQGDFAGAMEAAQRSVAILEEVLGPTHPRTAASYNEIGLAAHGAGDHELAEQWLTRGLDVVRRTFGAGHPDTAKPLMNLGRLAADQGDLDLAIERYEASMQIQRKAFGEHHEGVAINLLGLSQALMSERPEEALKYAEKSLETFEAGYGDEHPATSNVHHTLGVIAQALGDDERALAEHTRCLELREARQGPDAVKLIFPLSGLHHLADKAGDDARAAELAARGRKLCARAQGPALLDTCKEFDPEP